MERDSSIYPGPGEEIGLAGLLSHNVKAHFIGLYDLFETVTNIFEEFFLQMSAIFLVVVEGMIWWEENSSVSTVSSLST